MVLTEEQQVDAYPAATMEIADSTTENKFYSNLSETRTATPWGYPTDNYTNPNNKVAALRGQGNKIGPAIVLKVMAGDMFNVRVSSWYTNFLSSNSDNSLIVTDLLNVLASGVSHSGGKGTPAQISGTGALSSAMSIFLDDQELDANSAKPMAFLNWILFDEQFKIVETSSGFDQVGTEDQLTVHQFNNLPIYKNGYLYVYVSNASEDDWVYFDNLQVTHTRGPILEETHYYPFGLMMSAISSKGADKVESKLKYNGKEQQRQEFSNGTGLDWTDYGLRMYDNQIGRWHAIDPMADSYTAASTYCYAINNPLNLIDPNGAEVVQTAEGLTFTGADGIAVFKELQKMESLRGEQERMYNKWMRKISAPLEAMKNDSRYSREDVIAEATRLSKKYQNRKWFRFFLPESKSGDKSHNNVGYGGTDNENYSSQATGWKFKNVYIVNPYLEVSKKSFTARRQVNRDNRDLAQFQNNTEYGTSLWIPNEGIVTADFFPYREADDFHLIVGRRTVETTGMSAFEGDTEVNGHVTVSAVNKSGIPQHISFRVENFTESPTAVSNWRLIITVTSAVNVINPLQSVEQHLIPK